MKKSLYFVLLLLMFSVACIIGQEENPAESITTAELKGHIYFLASDYLSGRQPGDAGYNIAAEYAATQFHQASLQKGYDAENGKSYFQPVPLVQYRLGDNNSLSVSVAGEEKSFEIMKDYIMWRPGKERSKTFEHMDIIFAGYGIHEPDDGWDDFEGLDINGKVVLILSGAPKKDGKPVLPEEKHSIYSSMRGAIAKYDYVVSNGGAAFVLVPDTQVLMGWVFIAKMLTERINVSLDVAEEEPDTAMNPSIPIFLANKTIIDFLFANQKYNPFDKRVEYPGFDLENASIGFTVDMFKEPVKSNNVVAIVPGTDPELKDEYITLGAHLDHEGTLNGKVMNGADDNASGSAAVIEIAEAMAMKPTRRSVIFILYSAEEMGLLGSEYFANNPVVPAKNIMLNINLDMIGRKDKNFPDGYSVIGSAKRSDELKEIIISVNEKTTKLELDFSTDVEDKENYFKRSDQYSFHKVGIPAFMFSTGEHGDYHTPNDDAEKIEFEKVRDISRFCYELIQALGNRDEGLKLKEMPE